MNNFQTMRFEQSTPDVGKRLIFNDDPRSKDKRRGPKFSSIPEVNSRLVHILARAEKKGMEFDLDEAWLKAKLALEVCEVTGIRFSGNGLSSPFSKTIDRTDNSIGYLKSNCKIVVWIYNQAKKDFKKEDVLEMARCLVAMHHD